MPDPTLHRDGPGPGVTYRAADLPPLTPTDRALTPTGAPMFRRRTATVTPLRVVGCDHEPELRDLRQQILGLTAERNSLARDLAGVREHLRLMQTRLDAYAVADLANDRERLPGAHAPLWAPEPEETT